MNGKTPAIPDQALSPAEACRLVGVSPKALRVWEQLKLVRPLRTGAGWRVFGPEEVARLYQIKTLKGFGFSLERIGRLLSDDAKGRSMLAEVLALQAQALAEEQGRVASAIGLVRRALAATEGGGSLAIADLARLSGEAAVAIAPDGDLTERMRPYIERHFAERDYRRIEQSISERWQALFAEAYALHASGADPGAPEAADLLRRWDELVQLFTGGDETVQRKSSAAFEEAMNDPSKPPPIDPKVWAFLKEAKRRIVEGETR
jgi:DNA-binding transcriptional MerR regulator